LFNSILILYLFFVLTQTAEKELQEYDIDVEAEFQRLHRARRISSRIDSNNSNAHVFTR